MTDQAFVGRVYLERGDGASPQNYTRVCEVFDMGGIGERNEQVESTTFCSNGFKQFIAGMAEGEEITFDANFIVDSEQRRQMIADIKLKRATAFRIVVDDDNDGNADLIMWFGTAPIAWNFRPSVSDKNQIQWTYKISGEIDITEP